MDGEFERAIRVGRQDDLVPDRVVRRRKVQAGEKIALARLLVHAVPTASD
jgi:hypothetical protein